MIIDKLGTYFEEGFMKKAKNQYDVQKMSSYPDGEAFDALRAPNCARWVFPFFKQTLSPRSAILILIIISLITLMGCATALTGAASRGDIQEANRLLDAGADVNEVSMDTTALIEAGAKGKTNMVRLLIDRGADVNYTPFEQTTALHFAAIFGHIDTVRALLEKGADVNAKDQWNWTPLQLAIVQRHDEIARLLVEAGSDLKVQANFRRRGLAQGGTALEIAQRNGRADIVRILREAEKEKPKSYAKIEPPSPKALSPPAAIPPAPKGKSDVDTVPAFREEERVVGDNDVAIVIGIEKYQVAPPAEYSANDARTMRDYLMALGFKPRNITLLVDDQATMGSLRKTINSWLPPRVKEGSLVFFYYSGHGAPDPRTGKAYLVPHDGDPNYISDTGYPLDDLYDALGKLGAREAAVVLDACFSGAGGRGLIAKGAKPLVMEVKTKAISQNVLVMASTQGTQISTTAPEKQHGLFTYFFLKGLRAGKGEIGALYEYLTPLVEDEAKLMNVEQKPSLNPQPEKVKGRFKLLR